MNKEIILVGGGIMSANLAMLLNELNPDLRITVLERFDKIATESTDAWNNAGTGHSAFCELNYTPEDKNKNIDTKKAFKICEEFEISKQFWSFLVKNKKISSPEKFIYPIPHLSFVWGDANVDFLKRRYELLVRNELFNGMIFSSDFETISSWVPLMFEKRKNNISVAATRIDRGTDIDFGSLCIEIFTHLQKKPNFQLKLNQDVKDIRRAKNGWKLKVLDRETGTTHKIDAQFVFIGAGGYSQILLEKSGIPESKGYAGFPVSGQWLRCTNRELINKHQAKVYGKASVGAPPMSVPHLDTRIIKGERALLFGPYAGFSTKFLKKGSYFDWFSSVTTHNLIPSLHAGKNNLSLTKYLIKEVLQSKERRLSALRKFVPDIYDEDWELVVAGQRVQVIKKCKEKGGKLEFGTEVITAADGTLAALLGASPGASIAVSAMLEVIRKCFASEWQSTQWQSKLKEMIPSFGESLIKNAEICAKVRSQSDEILKISK